MCGPSPLPRQPANTLICVPAKTTSDVRGVSHSRLRDRGGLACLHSSVQSWRGRRPAGAEASASHDARQASSAKREAATPVHIQIGASLEWLHHEVLAARPGARLVPKAPLCLLRWPRQSTSRNYWLPLGSLVHCQPGGHGVRPAVEQALCHLFCGSQFHREFPVLRDVRFQHSYVTPRLAFPCAAARLYAERYPRKRLGSGKPDERGRGCSICCTRGPGSLVSRGGVCRRSRAVSTNVPQDSDFERGGSTDACSVEGWARLRSAPRRT